MFRTGKEILRVVKDIHRFICVQHETIVVLREANQELQIQNKDLMDRLMSTHFQEFKTFTVEPDPSQREEAYDPLEDEGLAGEVVEDV